MMVAATSGLDYGYVSPHLSFFYLLLLVVFLLFSGLAFNNLRQMRKVLAEFLKAEATRREADTQKAVELADTIGQIQDKAHKEFLSHVHDATGKVICGAE